MIQKDAGKMLELSTPIAAHVIAAEYDRGALDPSALVFSAAPPGALVQLAGWSNFSDAAEPALRTLGLSGLGDYKSARTVNASICYRLERDRLLLRSDDAGRLRRATDTLSLTEVAILDLSHARWVLRIEGTFASDLLARLAPLDFDLSAFPAGSFAQTGIHRVGVLVHRLAAERFDVLVPYTWMDSIWKICAANLIQAEA
jgi:heterotetrameric sarcosine oxidase gamma subunit